MPDPETLEENKLRQLLEAVESVLEHEDAEEKLGLDTLHQFSDIRKLVRAWLLDESALTREQRLDVLKNFTSILAQKKLIMDRGEASLH